MTVEEVRGRLGGGNGNDDRFPVGMRVLAVDDDPTCLMLLEGLLRKCQYQVTTTSQARMALQMLRENRNRFDLIISDVHMPDMDGFKLLELVGLEMDLPVIMLSAYSDTKLVMKGITHGACDYLVKPVRIEELKNIWQHVIRRKKVDSRSRSKSVAQDSAQRESGEVGLGPALECNGDQNGNLSRKRKDEEEEDEEDEHDDEDPAAQKKPRVVWSIELHRKFVGAVNRLGVEQAVPKRILDMMDVEGLTRENVASHLQKYRLYLRRISSVTNQQANLFAALGGKDSSYMHIGSFDGLGDFQRLVGSGRLPNSTFSSYPPGGILGRLNTSTGVGLRSLSSSALIQASRAHISSNSINSIGKFQPIVSPANQIGRLFHGIPASTEIDHLQQSDCSNGGFNSTADPTNFTADSNFADSSVALGSSSNSLVSAPNNPLMLQRNPQQAHIGNQASFKVASFNTEPFNIGVSGSSSFRDNGRFNVNWQSPIQLAKCSSNSLPLTEPFNHRPLQPNTLSENASSFRTQVQNSQLEFSSISTASVPLEDSRGEMLCQALVGDNLRNINQAPNQRWGEHNEDYTHNSNHSLSTLSSLVPANGVLAPLSQNLDQNNGVYNKNMNVSLVGQSNSGASSLVQHSEVERSTMDSKVDSIEDYLLEQRKLQGGFVPNNYDSLDDLVNAIIKRECEGTMVMDGEFGFDTCSFGSSL